MLVEKELNWLAKQHVGQITDVKQFKNALTNDVFLITNQQEKAFIFKRLNRDARSDKDRKAELLVQQLAFAHALTPQVLAHNQDYKLQHYIPGELLQTDQPQLETLLATQLHRIHQLPARHAPKQRLAFELQRLKQQRPADIDEVRFLQMSKLAETLDKRSPCDTLCHGDLSLNNILQGDDKKYYILDWEYAVVACVAYDLAFCSCINNYSEVERKLLVKRYYEQLCEPQSMTLNSLQNECELYFELFSYINALWAICFVDNS